MKCGFGSRLATPQEKATGAAGFFFCERPLAKRDRRKKYKLLSEQKENLFLLKLKLHIYKVLSPTLAINNEQVKCCKKCTDLCGACPNQNSNVRIQVLARSFTHSCLLSRGARKFTLKRNLLFVRSWKNNGELWRSGAFIVCADLQNPQLGVWRNHCRLALHRAG